MRSGITIVNVILQKANISKKYLMPEKLNYGQIFLYLLIVVFFEFVMVIQDNISISLVVVFEIAMMSMIGVSYLVNREETPYLILYVILIIYQNIIISLISITSGKLFSNNYKLVPPISFVYIVLLFILSWLTQTKKDFKNIKPVIIIFMLNLCLIFINFFRGESNFMSRVAYFRNFILYMILFLVSFNLINYKNYDKCQYIINYNKAIQLINAIALNGFVVVAIGFVFYIFNLEKWLILNFGIVSVFQAKGFDLNDIITPGMWYTDFLGKHRKDFFLYFLSQSI